VDGSTTAADAGDKKKEKKDKVRSAWISFAGRIVAQIVGAAATIVLGLLFVQKYQSSAERTSGAPAATTDAQQRLAAAGSVDRARGRPPDVAQGRQQRPAGVIALAVLPLENFSGDPAQEYFADGMTEALITDLAQIDGLHVISRTSSMHYKDQRKPLPDIARELGVDLIVEGSVAKAGERVRITAQLIDASTDEHLWARNYDRTLRDVLTLQAEVATAVAREVNVAVTPRRQGRLANRAAVDPTVYELYLKGRQAWARRTSAGFDDAIRYFEQAIAKDADFALAHAGLADAYSLLGISLYGTMSGREAFTRAKAAADRAPALDSGSAEAHTSLASVRWRYDWDWAEAEREFHRALELNPGYATAHSWYAIYLAEQGRPDDAAVEAQRALQLDPLSANAHRASGIVHYHARRFDLAETAQRRALALEPASVASRLILAWTLVERGNPRGAIDVCTEMSATTPDPVSPTRVSPVAVACDRDEPVLGCGPPGGRTAGVEDQVLATLAYAHARMGDRKSAEEIGRRLLSQQPAPTLAAALRVHVALGDRRGAIAALDRAITDRSGSDLLTALKVDPLFDQMRSDPRFAALLARLKLSESR
jgi:TolB-like protein/Flp pilus assembly protein TadD